MIDIRNRKGKAKLVFVGIVGSFSFNLFLALLFSFFAFWLMMMAFVVHSGHVAYRYLRPCDHHILTFWRHVPTSTGV